MDVDGQYSESALEEGRIMDVVDNAGYREDSPTPSSGAASQITDTTHFTHPQPPSYQKAPGYQSSVHERRPTITDIDEVIEGSKASNGYISGIDPAEETETEDDEFNYQDAGPSRKTGRPSTFQELIHNLPSQQPAVQEMQKEFSTRRQLRSGNQQSVKKQFDQLMVDDEAAGETAYQTFNRALARRSSGFKRESDVDFQSAGLRILDDIKHEPRTMHQKKTERREVEQSLIANRAKISGWTLWWAETSMAFRAWRRRFYDGIVDAQIWNKGIKKLEGKHGQAVGTFYKFLRWNLLLNLLMGSIFMCFVVAPYILQETFKTQNRLSVPALQDSYSSNAQFLGLFTGGAALNTSAYFIGSYMVSYPSNDPSEVVGPYEIPLAYLLATGVSLLLIMIAILFSVGNNIYHMASFVDEGQTPIAQILFTEYDHTLTDATSVLVKQQQIAFLLKEQVFEQETKAAEKNKNFKKLLLRRIFVNIMVTIELCLCFWAIAATVQRFANSPSNSIESVIPSIVMSMLNQIVPISFEIWARAENWRSPLNAIQWSIVRSFLLRMGSLYAFFYTYFAKRGERMCWESFVGQQIYSALVITFMFEIVTSFIIDPIKKYLYENTAWFPKYLQTARFQTIKNTLEMLWTQAIVWFGTFYCPLLPFLGAFKHFLLFYCKQYATMKYCAPPRATFRATYSLGTLVSFMMLFCMLIIILPLGYSITNVAPSGAYLQDYDRWIDQAAFENAPSCTTATASCVDCLSSIRDDSLSVCFKTSGGNFDDGVQTTLGVLCNLCPSGCGPFRHQESVYAVMLNEYASWAPNVQNFFNYLGTMAFAVVVVFALTTWIIIIKSKLSAQTKLISRLQLERDMERTDKRWILQHYAIVFDSNAQGNGLQ